MESKQTVKNIKINGIETGVLNSYSCGPGCPAHTHYLKHGYVYEVANLWYLQLPGQLPQAVIVEQ